MKIGWKSPFPSVHLKPKEINGRRLRAPRFLVVLNVFVVGENLAKQAKDFFQLKTRSIDFNSYSIVNNNPSQNWFLKRFCPIFEKEPGDNVLKNSSNDFLKFRDYDV